MTSRLVTTLLTVAVSAAAFGAGAVAVQSFVAPTSAAATAAPPLVAELGPDALTRGPSAVVVGNPLGDVTVIEFFDYQCPVCRKVHPFLEQLVAEDKNVRVIHKHWPLFGAPSIYAARIALAARWQDRYEQVHHAFMNIPGRLDEEKIRKAASEAGLDLARAERDLKERDAQVDQAFKQASAQAAMLKLQGTPGFVIGSYLIPGGLDLKTMKEIVADVRAKKRDGKQG
ncbi:DsbA family protein [Roseomonas genomospecies 6]|uniref:DsbA family protein n=1 Tax=Roseomonas genomospecies 6 TaxID=214106 RepID=A0A9W7KNI9_9PROT|nr:DsbA family protein [Roseomonas genomospecies 6]KAA0676025.1 DsbA family protein [Roseomonas genomospecies 6]